MSIWLSVILCALLGYLLGCINPAYLIARARGFDIRSRGSGNVGGLFCSCSAESFCWFLSPITSA